MKNNDYVLGVKVNISGFDEILSRIEESISQNKKITIAYLTPHIANYCYRHICFKDVFNGFDVIYPDGIGIVIASKLNGGRLTERITVPDYIEDVCNFLIKKDASVFLLGSKSFVVNNAARALKEKYPCLNIAGYNDGFFDFKDNHIIERINEVKPNLLFVGMGLPLQEEWIYKNKDRLNANAIWACGGLFDIISGRIRRAPDWMLKNNLEWLYRLYREPKRLWKRYLIGNPLFMIRVLKNLLRSLVQRLGKLNHKKK